VQEINVKKKKREIPKLTDLRNGMRGSVWLSKANRNFAGKLSPPVAAPSLFTQ
jgi:hypothetical protein